MKKGNIGTFCNIVISIFA